ncbi:hypothetical protein [Micromonospora sp. NPDC048898]|uniref:hypothetical protein n=1 Tax=Micromonospora sp. NPDC048898 TaxID=3364260 RepID=UPI0037100B7F
MVDDGRDRVAATQDAVAVVTAWLAQRQGDDLYHQQVDQVIEEHGELGTLRLATGLTNLCGFLVYRLARLQGQDPEEVLRDVARRIASA